MRLAEFRSANRPRLPEELWRAAEEIAAQRGMKITSGVLHLDTNSLTKWMDEQAGQVQRPAQPKRVKRKHTRRKAAVIETPATFLELLAPSPGSAASRIMEVESPRVGKVRMELKGVATREITQLIQAFAGQRNSPLRISWPPQSELSLPAISRALSLSISIPVPVTSFGGPFSAGTRREELARRERCPARHQGRL